MTANEYRAIQRQHKRVLEAVKSFAWLAAEWEPAKEDDFEEFSNEILDIILDNEV